MQLGLLVLIHNETSARGSDTGKIDKTRQDDGEETVLCCLFPLCHFRVLKLRYGYIGIGGCNKEIVDSKHHLCKSKESYDLSAQCLVI